MKDYNIFTKKELIEFLEECVDTSLLRHTAYEWLAAARIERLKPQMDSLDKEMNTLIKELMENIGTAKWFEIYDKLQKKQKNINYYKRIILRLLILKV